MGFILNPNWRNENLTCHFCGKTRSVKYKTKILIVDSISNDEEKEIEVCVCNKCALPLIGLEESGYEKENEAIG